MTKIPDHLTCTHLLEQWHVPRKDESDEAVLYENIVFEKAVYEKDVQAKKRKHTQSLHIYNPLLHIFHKQYNKMMFKTCQFIDSLRADYIMTYIVCESVA